MSTIHDPTRCNLGEGPLWHPEREQLFWFDIMRKRLMTREAGATRVWEFPELVSAAGWIDAETLLIASESALLRFDLDTGKSEIVTDLEADTPLTRSNDGRADPWGGFWIGTMGKLAEPGAGAIWRYFKGELRRLFAPLSIANSICFSPDGAYGYFSDTAAHRVMRVPLAKSDGWPMGAPEVFLDLTAQVLNPDGAVIDSLGRMWLALWGGGRVVCYGADGAVLETHDFPATNITCPAFGGADLGTLYATSARQGLSRAQQDAQPEAGMTFSVAVAASGQREPRVRL